MPPVKRAATAGVNFGDNDAFYVGGGAVPEGDYALEFGIQMHSGFKAGNNNPPRLGTMVTAHDLNDPGTQAKQFFLGWGKNSEKSFVPNAAGTGVDPVPGGPAMTVNDSTNWALFRKSLYDCGLPKGVFTEDISVLNGIHVHLQNIPEPESRKNMASSAQTGEVQQERMGSGTVPVVSEIKDDGKPWEGTGGFDFQTAAVAPVAKAVSKVAPKTAAKPVAKAAPVEEAVDNEDVQTAAVNAISAVLEAKPAGLARLLLRTETFKHANKSDGVDMAQTVLKTYFENDNDLNGLLGQLGFQVANDKVTPKPD